MQFNVHITINMEFDIQVSDTWILFSLIITKQVEGDQGFFEAG